MTELRRDMPAPLVPADVDLRDLPYMPVDIGRLFGSEFNGQANDAEWRAAVTLWLKSYHQVPAASLPSDDVQLARLAEFGRDVRGWKKVKEKALWGWVRCEDGRIYHPVVAEKALEAWIGRLSLRLKGAVAIAKRWKKEADTTSIEAEIGIAVGLLRSLNPSARVLHSPNMGKLAPVKPDTPPEEYHGYTEGKPDTPPEEYHGYTKEKEKEKEKEKKEKESGALRADPPPAPADVPSFDDLPPPSPTPVPADMSDDGGDPRGSLEDQYWHRVGLVVAGTRVARSRFGQLANLLNGDFERGLVIIDAVAKAKTPSAYLGAIIRDMTAETSGAAPPKRAKGEPEWVARRRAEGAFVEREGPNRWRDCGILHDDEGREVGW
ncbi:DUF1376 domain-containing protein [Xanthobacter aminoxidans]|uniref:DUF1376 domain-containing protein n=1 Tax=Xanthobacter aminoxidans TaxID=186280 RepID=A0ABW6ZA68_9HYPH